MSCLTRRVNKFVRKSMCNTKQMESETFVKITHNSQPFCRRRGVLVKTGRGKDPKIKLRLKGGVEVELKRSWTDLQPGHAPELSEAAENLFDAAGLLEIVKRVNEIKSRGDDGGNKSSGKKARKERS